MGDCFGEYALLAEETLHNNFRVQHVSSISSPRSSPRSPRGRVGVLGQKCLPTPTAASRVVGQPYSAIGLEEDTLLLIVPADTYRRTLQKRHIAQREVVRRALALWNMPLFRQVSFAKVCNLAHSIEIQKYIYKHVLAEYLHEIQSVYLIIKGEVKVVASLPSALSPGKQAAAPLPSALSSDQQPAAAGSPLDLPIDSLYDSTTSGLISPRVPIPSVDVLQPGQVVGEVEVSKGLTSFRFHYTIQSLHTEVVVMPLHLYIECMREYMLDCKELMHINVTVLSEEERALRLEFRQSRLREIKLLSRLLSGKNASIAGSSVGSSIDREGSFVNSVSVDVGNNGSCSRWSQFGTPQKQQLTQKGSISSSVMHYPGSAQSARYYPAAQPSSSRPSPIKRAPGRQRKHTCTATTNSGTSSGISIHKQQPVQQQTPKTDSCPIQEDNSDDELKNDATSTVNSGPNACMEYAATFEDATVRVQEALQNIRERVRAKKENHH